MPTDEATARLVRSFYVETPPVDQEALQLKHPPPVAEIEIHQPKMTLAEFKAYTRQTTELARARLHKSQREIAAMRWGRGHQSPTAPQPVEMPRAASDPRPRSRSVRTSPRAANAPPAGEDDDPPGEAPHDEVEPRRRRSDLLPARIYIWREVLRLLELAEGAAERRHDEAVADRCWRETAS